MILHYANNAPGNAGDTVLTAATRRALSRLGTFQPERLDLDARADDINRHSGVLVGGGGLFLCDSKPGVSGWRWHISRDELRRVNVPIIVYAVGFNRFRGQTDFPPAFGEHIGELIERAAFFSMRDRIAPEQMRPYVGELAGRIHYQPCPAALLSRLYPEYVSVPKRGTLVFVPAMDRAELRGIDAAAGQIVKALHYARARGWRVVVAGHIQMDRDFMRYAPGFEFVDLHKKTAREIMDFYAPVSLVIGLRLHSAVIPFGLGCAIAPVVSHDKVAHFLSDINHPEWGVEIGTHDLADRLVARIEAPTTDGAPELAGITERNTETIVRVFEKGRTSENPPV